MPEKHSQFSQYEFRKPLWFDQSKFDGFNWAIPMKTPVIYCFDPRGAEIPQALAAHFGDGVQTKRALEIADCGNKRLLALAQKSTSVQDNWFLKPQ